MTNAFDRERTHTGRLWGDVTYEELDLLIKDGQIAAAIKQKIDGDKLDSILSIPVSKLGLSSRPTRILHEMGIFTVGELLERSESELLCELSFGRKSLGEVTEALASLNLTLPKHKYR